MTYQLRTGKDTGSPGVPRLRRAPILRAAVLALGACLLLGAGTAEARSKIDPPMAYGRVPADLYALRDPNIFTHNVGLLTLQITNVGLIGNPYINDFSAGWRGGSTSTTPGCGSGPSGPIPRPTCPPPLPPSCARS